MKSILIIVPFDNIYPPMNGGMQRCFHVMHQLARHFDLTAIIHQDKETFLKCTKAFPALSSAKIYSTKHVKKKDVFNLLPSKFEMALRSRWYQKQWNRPADSSLIKYYPILTSLLKQKAFDLIVIESLATLNAVKIIRRYDKKVKIIYDAHNVDSNLVRAAVKRHEMSSTQLKGYEDTESNFHKIFDAVITCSRKDKEILNDMNGGRLLIDVVPNGVNIPEKIFNEGIFADQPEGILFCGSLGSIPNAEGLHWFCKNIWPMVTTKYTGLKLWVVGSGELPTKYSPLKSTANVVFAGAVPDVTTYYQKSALAIVPLLTGSGTRLKVLESMGMGVPVISTSIGAEGIDYTDGKDILIADKEEYFAQLIVGLLQSNKQRQKIAKCARELAVHKYDWNVIGYNLLEGLNRCLWGGVGIGEEIKSNEFYRK